MTGSEDGRNNDGDVDEQMRYTLGSANETELNEPWTILQAK